MASLFQLGRLRSLGSSTTGRQRKARRMASEPLEARQLLAVTVAGAAWPDDELQGPLSFAEQPTGPIEAPASSTDATSPLPSWPGFYDGSGRTFFSRNTAGQGVSDQTTTQVVADAQWQAIVGDWDGDGSQTPGFYDPQTATFLLHNDPAAALPEIVFSFGTPGSPALAVVGDWDGNGRDGVGLYDPSTSHWQLKNVLVSGSADVWFDYGPSGNDWAPLAGDWNGDGRDGVGFFDPELAQWFFKNGLSQGLSDTTFFYGHSGGSWNALVGDWNGDGRDSAGFYDRSVSQWFLKNGNSQGLSDTTFFYGPAGNTWHPLAGHWTGLATPAGGQPPLGLSYLVAGNGPNQVATTTFDLLVVGGRFHNEVGTFLVQDAAGRIGNLYPGDPGYALAALAGGSHQVLFPTDALAGRSVSLAVPSGLRLGLYLIQDRTAEEYLALNPTGDPTRWPPAFFGFPAGNPDGVPQVLSRPNQVFAWEDKGLDGDRDFDDSIGRVRFTAWRSVPEADQIGVTLGLDPEHDTPPTGDSTTTAALVGLIGETAPGALVELLGSGLATVADGSGQFRFDLVPLALGANGFQVRAATADGRLGLAGTSVTRETPPDVEEASARIASISPANGSQLVSLTRETVVHFDHPIAPDSVTEETFYAVAKGQRLAGHVRVSPTGLFATLFYDAPLPESTEVRVYVDGDHLLAADGRPLDGDGDGQAGGVGMSDFRTLPLTFIPGTAVYGYVYDSYNRNADGSNIPVVGATISLDARPDVMAVTDEDGFFELTTPEGLPAPEFFVHIDGSTAVGAPNGTVYATLGKPFHTVPGQRVPLAMANGTPFDIFLPPMALGDVVPLDPSANTVVRLGAYAQNQIQQLTMGPGALFTPEEAQRIIDTLQVIYPAGSAQDAQGNPATLATVIPVDPSRLPAPLPPTVNPRLVISVQAGSAAGFNLAGGSTNFDVPAPVVFPNLEGLLPGDRPALWSFDHDAGAWIPIGTGTVTPDGQAIVSDPGVGILAPGWHFSSPPQNWTGSGNEPQRPMTDEPPPMVFQQLLHTGDSDTLSFEFTAPSDGAHPRPGQHDPPGPNPPSRVVTITVDGPLADYYKAKDGGGVRSGTWTLRPGDADLTISSELKTLDELKTDINGAKPFDLSYLYGSKIKVREVLTAGDGSKQITTRIVFPYLLIDATDDRHDDGTLSFAPTANDGANGAVRTVPLVVKAGASKPQLSVSGGNGFTRAGDLLSFDPASTGNLTAMLQVREPMNNQLAGSVSLAGQAVDRQGWYMDATSFETLLAAIAADSTGTVFPTITAHDRALVDTRTERDALYTAIANRTDFLYSSVGQGIYQATGTGANVLTITFAQTTSATLLGGATGSLTTADIGQATIVDVYNHRNDYGRYERAFRAAKEVNKQLSGSINFYLQNFFDGTITTNGLSNTLGKTTAHEVGHHLGLFHTNTANWAGPAGGANDIMRQGLDIPGTLRFRLTLEAAKLGVHGNYTAREADKAIAYYALPGVGSHDTNNGEEDGDIGPGIPLFDEPTLGVIDSFGAIVTSTAVFDPVIADGAGGELGSMVWTVGNFGPGEIHITSVSLGPGSPEIGLAQDPSGLAFSGDLTAALELQYDPIEAGSDERELLITTDTGEVIRVLIQATALAVDPLISSDAPNNNLGGVALGSSVENASLATIVNQGSQDLVLSNIALARGSEDFQVLGFDSQSPVTLAPGESYELAIAFHPSRVGLRPGTVELTTNDPLHPTYSLGVVGTGIPTGGIDFDWGGDYVAMTNRGFTQRTVSNLAGGFVFNANVFTAYSLAIFDPVSGLIADDQGITGPSGAYTDMTSALIFHASDAPDSDYDGLPDDIEFAIGTAAGNPDSDGDGVDDLAEITQGLNPLGEVGFPTGVISNLPLNGPAEGLAVENDLIYAATGSGGLAIVDGQQFNNPILLGQLDLSGNATGVAVDTARAVAAVATGSALALVDVSDPMLPALSRTVGIPASQVEIHGGLAFVTGDAFLRAVDLATGDVVQTLLLPGSGTPTDLARQGNLLFVYQSGSDLLSVIDIGSEGQAAVVGQLSVSIASSDIGLFAGNDTVWLIGSGLRTVDVADPAHPVLVGLPQDGNDFFTARRAALNGSGLGLVLPDGGSAVSLHDLAERTQVGAESFLNTFPLSAAARSVAISRGIGYVGTSAGLEVVNYRSFDALGQPPTVELTVDAIDADPGTPGLQVLEGRTISFAARTSDDVQVRMVELLADGQVVATDVAYPFDFSVPAMGAQLGAAAAAYQLRATDTGGNTSLSFTAEIGIVPDTFPPEIVSIDPADGGQRYVGQRSVRVRFNEPLADASIAAGVFQLVSAGPDQLLGTGDDTTLAVAPQLRDDGRLVQLTFDPLTAGQYQLSIDQGLVSDRSGNPLSNAPLTSTFLVVELDASTEFLPFGTEIQDIRFDDVSVSAGPLPFTFDYFGQPVAGPMYVTSNGVIEFNANSIGGSYSNGALPRSSAVDAVFALWDDHYPPAGGRIGLYDGDGVRAITWENLPHYGNRSVSATFQVALLANGTIQIRYGDVTLGDGGATIGIQGGDSAVVPDPGQIANKEVDFGVTSSGGQLNSGGLDRLDEIEDANDLLQFIPDGQGSYTLVHNPRRD